MVIGLPLGGGGGLFWQPGMPDGIFANQKFQFGFIFGVPLCGNRWYIL
jgi:hypothetical protein